MNLRNHQSSQSFYCQVNNLLEAYKIFSDDDLTRLCGNISEKELSEKKAELAEKFARTERVIGQLQNMGKHSITMLPDLDWVFGNLYNILTEDYPTHFTFLPASFQLNVANNLSRSVTLAWNGFDFICSSLMAVYLFQDKENYHQTQNKIKASMQVLSAVMLGALTYTPWLILETNTGPSDMALAYVVMAATAIIDIGNAGIDYYNAYKKSTFLGRFEEGLREAQYLEQRIQKFASNLEKENDAKQNYFTQRQLIMLYLKYKKLHEQMDIDAHCSLSSTVCEVIDKNILYNQMETIFKNNNNADELPFFEVWHDYKSYIENLPDHMDEQKELIEKCQQKKINAGWRFLMKFVSFVGISLYAASQFDESPWIISPALLLVIISSIYLGKHQYQHIRKECVNEHGFFAKSGKKAAEVSALLQVTIDERAPLLKPYPHYQS